MNLLKANTLSRFWHIQPDATPAEWDAAARMATTVLPGGARVLGQSGWEGLMRHILGEEQYGPDRYRLSPVKRLYYALKPVIPRQFTILARRQYRTQQEQASRLSWPIEERYVRFLYLALANLLRERGASSVPMVAFWPGVARFAFVLTHDVETAEGQSFVRSLADLEERYGFRSSFNFVPERYPVDKTLIEELRARGFEVGVHGLKHDGKLFSSRAKFERRVRRINRYLREWDAVGFRSPLTHRNPEWLQALEIEYDLSFFDTDFYEAMPGGTMSIWPFLVGRFVELPYTLAQDHTLMVIVGEQTPRLWLEKVDFIDQFSGMVLLNAHPDYLRNPVYLAIYEQFLQAMQVRGGYWHALPREVARWWRARAVVKVARKDGQWVVLDLPEAAIIYVESSEQGLNIVAS